MNELNLNSEIWYNSFQKGEEVAFDTLFRTYFTSLTLFANRLVLDFKTAEDLVQDCFVLLWERRERLEHVKAIKSYLYTTVRNQSLKYLERQNRMGLSDNGDTLEGNVEKSIIAAETARELYQLISTLSPALQQIIRLYYLEEKSSKEIAEILKLQPDTVTRQRLRAIIALRKTKISF
ncbi:MAG: sigma-70 family RNA polymerase sigma factor [Chitinophagales bacterium]|nr:sigma-70 family RNA polymerase sigma factor [Chitinophagales bacterium]